MCEKCCQCSWEIGQTVISEVTEEGLICCQCKKLILFAGDPEEELADFDDLDDFADLTLGEMEGELDWSERGNPGLFGAAAFTCGHCEGLFFWKGPDQYLKHLIEDLRHSDSAKCPGCRKMSLITDEMRVMLND